VTGAAGPHVAGELEVHLEDRMVVVNGTYFHRGRASGAGCNCLIDTLRQHLRVTTDIPWVRRQLQLLFQIEPNNVTHNNFLDFRVHGMAIIRLLCNAKRRGAEPVDMSMFRIVCVDLQYLGQGDIIGNGDVTFHIARVHGNHFIPLREM